MLTLSEDRQAIMLPFPHIFEPSGDTRISSVMQGTLGVYVLLLAASETGLGDEAADLLRLWAGDSFVAYQQGSQVCVVARVEMDSPEAAISLAEMLTRPSSTALATAADNQQFEATFCG